MQDLLNSMFFADYCQGVPDAQDEQQADAHTPPQPDIQLDDSNIKVRCSCASLARGFYARFPVVVFRHNVMGLQELHPGMSCHCHVRTSYMTSAELL
jgi:hypothetical protein